MTLEMCGHISGASGGGKRGGGEGLRGVRMHPPPLRILSALFGMLNAFFTHYSILKP